MAKKTRKAKARVKSKKAHSKATTRKTKGAAKKAIAKKTAARKKAPPKAAPIAKKPATKPRRRAIPPGPNSTFSVAVDDKTPSPAIGGFAAKPLAPVEDEAKFLAVAGCVNVFFSKEKKKINPTEPLKDTDKISSFKFDTTSILPVLGIFRAQLKPPFTLKITTSLAEKCGAADETIRKLKTDINGATTRS